MIKGTVSYWINTLEKILKLLDELPKNEKVNKIADLLNEGKLRPYAPEFIDGDSIKELLDEINGLISKCSIPEPIKNHVQDKFKEVMGEINKGRERHGLKTPERIYQ